MEPTIDLNFKGHDLRPTNKPGYYKCHNCEHLYYYYCSVNTVTNAESISYIEYRKLNDFGCEEIVVIKILEA